TSPLPPSTPFPYTTLFRSLSQMLPDLQEVPESLVDDAVWDTFVSWTDQRGISLYPAQEEASLALLAGDNVILATPTGSGKSMVRSEEHTSELQSRFDLVCR